MAWAKMQLEAAPIISDQSERIAAIERDGRLIITELKRLCVEYLDEAPPERPSQAKKG